jgi:hypothetical protein
MIVGIQFLSTGLIGEMLSHLLHGRKREYLILEEVGFE